MHATDRAYSFAVLVAIPLLDVVVVVNVGCDATGALQSWRERLERIVERAWAIIIIGAASTIVVSVAFAGLRSADPLDAAMSVMVMFMSAMLAYAEPYACLDEEASPYTIVPFAFLRSMMLAWVNLPRVAAFFALTLAVTLADAGLVRVLLQLRAPGPAYWEFAYGALADAAIMTVFTVGYLETLAQERRY